MASPALSRQPSHTSLYSPSLHRRSHPNLQHLSLAPLTPKYPIDPSDFSPYFDPTTSSLHTSTSLSHIASIPSPSGVLSKTNPNSRSSSRTRHLKRKVKSTVSIRLPHNDPSIPSGAVSSAGYGSRNSFITPQLQPHSHVSRLQISTDPAWLVQTGLALTEGSRESKGQSWISQKNSTTSLYLGSQPRSPEETFLRPSVRSGRTTPATRSRDPSRKRRSRRDLAMTSAARTPVAEEGYEALEPDWADGETQAEIAARVESELAEELEFEDGDWEVEEGDPYGMLDFEGQGRWDIEVTEEDEEEVRKVILGRGEWGRWMGGVVDVLLPLEEGIEEKGKDVDIRMEEGMVKAEEEVVEEPPESRGVWGDIAWFGRVIARAAIS